MQIQQKYSPSPQKKFLVIGRYCADRCHICDSVRTVIASKAQQWRLTPSGLLDCSIIAIHSDYDWQDSLGWFGCPRTKMLQGARYDHFCPITLLYDPS